MWDTKTTADTCTCSPGGCPFWLAISPGRGFSMFQWCQPNAGSAKDRKSSTESRTVYKVYCYQGSKLRAPKMQRWCLRMRDRSVQREHTRSWPSIQAHSCIYKYTLGYLHRGAHILQTHSHRCVHKHILPQYRPLNAFHTHHHKLSLYNCLGGK